jgi:hypothetical protein
MASTKEAVFPQARQVRSAHGAAGAAVLALVAVACSSSSPSSTGSSGVTNDPTNAANCPTYKGPPALMAYRSGMKQAGEHGIYTFEILDDDNPPPALGTSTWVVKITDASGQLVANAMMPDIKPWMPQHNHGSTATPLVTNNSDGTYKITNLYLYMAGVWQIPLPAVVGTMTDSATFTFCLGS